MDVNGGQLTQTNGNPVFPGTTLTGPLLAGNIIHSDGSGALANVGETNTGTANVGYASMVQSDTITQAASAGQSAGVYASKIVIPAQSQIISILVMVTADWSGGAATFGIGNTVSATAYTAAAAITASALGQQTIVPGTGATQIGNWDNVGNSDVQIVFTSTNTGTGTATVSVLYAQGINLAS
jgi:hypothetical protein